MDSGLRFQVNDREVAVEDVAPTMTLLEFLRGPQRLTGTKEGCAEGDCGACTVLVLDEHAPGGPRARAVNSCLVLLPMVHGKRVYTVEGLAAAGEVHPVQEALVSRLGSQCGYCTPGVVMSLVEAAHRADLDAPWKLDDQMCGNLCRCTGYRPIRDAAEAVAGTQPPDAVATALQTSAPGPTTHPPLTLYTHHEQRFFMPRTFEALWMALEDPQARIVNGGTDLSLEVTKLHRKPPVLVTLEALPELRQIETTEQGWRIGAGVALSDLEDAMARDMVPLARILRFFGSRQIKHRATVGGNLCNASPIGDLAPVLLALEARLTLRSRQGRREVGVDEFFVGYRETVLQPGEILESVEVPRLPVDARAGAYKVSKRRELDISAVAAGFVVRLGPHRQVVEARLGYGGMAATPARARRTEQALLGATWSEATIEQSLSQLEHDFTPIDDHRGSAWFRGTLAKNLLRGFFQETQEQPVVPLPDRPVGTVLPEVTR